jgi:hypothetical protein
MSKALTIGQVAATTGVSTHTLRYYEQAGLIRAVGRTEAGHDGATSDQVIAAEVFERPARCKRAGRCVRAVRGDVELGGLRQRRLRQRPARSTRLRGLICLRLKISLQIPLADRAQVDQ